jgi:hypothetical protein
MINIEYITYKRTNRNYENIYTKPKEVKEICIRMKSCEITISEHQLGDKLDQPHVFIVTKDKTISMDMENFVKQITL